MYAVVKTGGKQYKVAKGDVIKVERLDGDAGDVIQLDEILMIGDGSKVTVGEPMISGAAIAAEILEQGRAKKVIVFKKRRRQNYRRKKGHKQHLSVLRVTDIMASGAKKGAAPKKAAAKPAAKKAAPKKAAATGIKDDVELIDGVGPVLKKKLSGFGVTTLTQIAAMSTADLQKMDDELELKGRTSREEWTIQAKDMLAGKAPRAKVDQAKADKK